MVKVYKPSDFFQHTEPNNTNEDTAEAFNDGDKALAFRDAKIKELENKNQELEESNKSLIIKCTELSEALKKESFKSATDIEQEQKNNSIVFENMTVSQIKLKLGELLMDNPTDTKFNFIAHVVVKK